MAGEERCYIRGRTLKESKSYYDDFIEANYEMIKMAYIRRHPEFNVNVNRHKRDTNEAKEFLNFYNVNKDNITALKSKYRFLAQIK